MRRLRFAVTGVPAGLLVVAMTISATPQTPRPLAQANTALQAGEADKALALLQSLPRPDAAEAHNLRCRVRYMLEQWDAAVEECEQAVRLDGQNSGYHLWLGRALGRKAARANFLSAFSLAKRVRAEFEESVRLNPGNAGALADLGQFYFRAPGVVGGGIEKAQGIAAQLDKVDPVRAHELRGGIAEARKDYGTAEREFKEAIAAGAHPAFQWVTLAGFYSRRERWTEMESAVHSCVTAAERDKHAGVALYYGASVLTSANRDPALAAKMFQDYLAGSAKTEEAPAFVALSRLARLKEKLGDPAAANQERAAALALAHEFTPGQDAKN
ncbi:MAG: tetratricopeptide repeat protein [Terracidiphilus sp.]